MKPFEQVKILLPQLSVPELTVVIERAQGLKQLSGTELVPNDTVDVDRALNAIVDTLLHVAGESQPKARLRRSQSFNAFAAKVPALLEYVSKATPHRVEQNYLLRLGYELLYYDLGEWTNVAVGATTLMGYTDRIPAVVNKHFPGYAANGLLAMLLKRGTT